MSWIKLVAVGLTLVVVSTISERIRYDNYKIYQVQPKTQEQLKLLAEQEAISDSLIYLDPVTLVDANVSILVAPHKDDDFVNFLSNQRLPYRLAVKNFQTILDAEIREFNARSLLYDWKGYHTLEENYDWLRFIANSHSTFVQLIVGGRTYEGREILGVKVSFKTGNKGIFIEGGIHAREWISPATITYILNELLTSKDPDVRQMAEKYDWYIFPHFNPDGFVYTHTTNRLWRKTRSPGTTCYGADPNRNWGFQWMTIGASSNECSDLYAGKSPFSEIETKSMSEYITSLQGKIHTYLSFHSYSQLLLYPYGHTEEPTPHDAHLAEIAAATTSAISKRYGTQYKYGTTYLAIYPVSGASPDWVYGVLGVPIAYTYELRPASSVNGFVLPSAEILPTCKETLDSLLALTKKAAELGYL